jgi:hypothetical protein
LYLPRSIRDYGINSCASESRDSSACRGSEQGSAAQRQSRPRFVLLSLSPLSLLSNLSHLSLSHPSHISPPSTLQCSGKAAAEGRVGVVLDGGTVLAVRRENLEIVTAAPKNQEVFALEEGKQRTLVLTLTHIKHNKPFEPCLPY